MRCGALARALPAHTLPVQSVQKNELDLQLDVAIDTIEMLASAVVGIDRSIDCTEHEIPFETVFVAVLANSLIERARMHLHSVYYYRLKHLIFAAIRPIIGSVQHNEIALKLIRMKET